MGIDRWLAGWIDVASRNSIMRQSRREGQQLRGRCVWVGLRLSHGVDMFSRDIVTMANKERTATRTNTRLCCGPARIRTDNNDLWGEDSSVIINNQSPKVSTRLSASDHCRRLLTFPLSKVEIGMGMLPPFCPLPAARAKTSYIPAVD